MILVKNKDFLIYDNLKYGENKDGIKIYKYAELFPY